MVPSSIKFNRQLEMDVFAQKSSCKIVLFFQIFLNRFTV